MDPTWPPPEGLADAPAGQQPAAGGWMGTYLEGVTGQTQGPSVAQNLAQLMIPPGMTGAGGGMFRIDPELAPQAIADLRHAAQLLRDEVRNAADLANYSSPGQDAVSRDAVKIISDAAIGEQGSLRAALLGGADEFERHAAKLEADLKTYCRWTRSTSRRLGRSSCEARSRRAHSGGHADPVGGRMLGLQCGRTGGGAGCRAQQ